MITARVTGYRDDQLIATVPRRVACRRCLDGKGCGMGLIGGTRSGTVTVAVPAPQTRPAPGSEITLFGAPGVVGAAMLGYGLPLAGVLVGAALGPVTAFAGLLAGVAVSRVALRGRVAWRIVDGCAAR
ncbi:MAG: SoxR reducing system RseC family protein [Pseudomonadota bacterium]